MTEKTKKIVHLSDLHIGEKYKGRPIFRADIAEKIVEEVNGIKPDIILISGDITADGNEPEYKQARAFLSKFNTPIVKDPNPNIVQELDDFSSPIFSVPGNHDSRHGGLEPEVGYLKKMDDAWSEFSHKTANMKSKEADALFVNTFKPVILNHYNECSGMNAFEKYIGKAQKIYNGHGFYVVGVNSSGIGLDMNGDGKIDNEDLRLAQSLGLVGVETMPWIRENLRKADPDDFKIVIMHHHLIGIPATGNDDNVLMDSGDILKLLVDEKVDLVLNGHKRFADIRRRNMYFDKHLLREQLQPDRNRERYNYKEKMAWRK